MGRLIEEGASFKLSPKEEAKIRRFTVYYFGHLKSLHLFCYNILEHNILEHNQKIYRP